MTNDAANKAYTRVKEDMLWSADTNIDSFTEYCDGEMLPMLWHTMDEIDRTRDAEKRAVMFAQREERKAVVVGMWQLYRSAIRNQLFSAHDVAVGEYLRKIVNDHIHVMAERAAETATY